MNNKIDKSVTFIVIGKNEKDLLPLCFDSIKKVRAKLPVLSTETIYVDSQSTDGSEDLAVQCDSVETVLKITGCVNAAIARNTGAMNAAGDIFCFVDGDMVLNEEIVPVILSVIEGQKRFVSGNFIDVEYYPNGTVKSSRARHSTTEEKSEAKTGGLFIIDRALWESVGGMQNSFRRSQDLDLGLRLAKRGYLLHRVSNVVATHHTVGYTDDNRFYKDFLAGNFTYLGLLVRKNLFNPITHLIYSKSYVSALFLLLFSIACVIFESVMPLAGYLIALVGKGFIRRSPAGGRFRAALQQIFVDLSFLGGFFLFFPNDQDLKFETIELKIK